MRAGWEYKKLGEVCEIFDSQRKPVTKSNRKQGCYPYYGATGIQDYVDSYIFDGRYILVGEDGAKWSAMERTSYIIEGKSWVNNHAHILQTKKELIDTYLMYYLNCTDLDNYISGAIVRKLTQASLRDIQIPFPPIPQQRLIVSELDEINSLIALKREQLKKYDELAQSLFYEMFGDPVENEKGWEVKKLGEVCDAKNKIERVSKVFGPTEQIQYIDISSIDNSVQKIIGFSLYIVKDAPSRAQQKVKMNDILISTVRPNLKNIAIIEKDEENLVASSGFCILRVSSVAEVRYVFHYVTSDLFTNHLNRLTTGANYPAVKDQDIRDSNIPLPPLSLQQLFAQRIEQIEEQKKQVTAAIAKLETLLASRMQYWFE